ncbi:MAG TPA: hypothetical protein VIV65_07275 [Gemmatimonadaceae bacterium]|jgi:hypothetical protein
MKPIPFLLVLAAIAACDLSTGSTVQDPPPRVVDSTGHPYTAYMVQGQPLPYTFNSGINHTVVSANLCLFTNGAYRFSEWLNTPSDFTPDAYYEYFGTYTLSPAGKVVFPGQATSVGGIGKDSLNYFYPLGSRSYLFAPDPKQLNQSCLKPATP